MDLSLLERAATVAAWGVDADDGKVRSALIELGDAADDRTTEVARRIARALALTDGAQFVTGIEGPTVPRHPLSGLPLGIETARQPYRASLLVPADTRGWWRDRWLTRPQAIRKATGSSYPLANRNMPDHTLWHRADFAVAAAHATADGGRPALLTLGFGRAQTFIAAARKASDLWAGSYLLSLLNAQALAALVRSGALPPEAIIFPAVRQDRLFLAQLNGSGGVLHKNEMVRRLASLRLDRPDDAPLSPSLPNRALLLVPEAAGEQIAGAYHQALADAWAHISDRAAEVFADHLKNMSPPRILSVGAGSLWRQQTDGIFPFTWGLVRWPTDGDGLDAWHDAALKVFTSAQDELDAHLETIRLTRLAIGNRRDDRRIGSNYGLFAAAAERFATGAKAARAFEAPPGGPWEKDTLVGEREQILPDNMVLEIRRRHAAGNARGFEQEIHRFWAEVHAAQSGRRGRLKPGTLAEGERLDAVGLTKRILPLLVGLERYPSTSHLATRAWEETLARGLEADADNDLARALTDFLDARDAFIEAQGAGEPRNPEGAIFGERPLASLSPVHSVRDLLRRLRERDRGFLFEDEYPSEDHPELAKRAKGALARLRDALSAANLPHPPRYYALLFFDGDEMGRWASGVNAPRLGELLGDAVAPELAERRRPLTPAHQVSFSEALANFNAVARRIVESGYGTVVYAGGDDVLAMVPTANALRIAELLRFAFAGQVRVREPAERVIPLSSWTLWEGENEAEGRLGGVFWDPGGVVGPPRPLVVPGAAATLSGGIVVAHEKSSLARAFRELRAAEGRSKRDVGRNAVVVTALKRSGERLSACVRFTPANGDPPARAWTRASALPLRRLEVLRQALSPLSRGDDRAPAGLAVEEILGRRPVSSRYPARLRMALRPILPLAPDRYLQSPERVLDVVRGTLNQVGTRQVHWAGDGASKARTWLQETGRAALQGYAELVEEAMAELAPRPPGDDAGSFAAVEGETPRRSSILGACLEELILWPAVLEFIIRGER